MDDFLYLEPIATRYAIQAYLRFYFNFDGALTCSSDSLWDSLRAPIRSITKL